MSRYQGKALHRSPAEPRRHSPFRRPLRVLVAMLLLGAIVALASVISIRRSMGEARR